MAKKVAYNNIQYDIINAIRINSRDYLIMLNPDNFYDIRYIEKASIDGVERYFLPPTDFSLEKNVNTDLKRLQVNIIVNKLVEILKEEVVKENLKTSSDINKKLNEIKSFCDTDLTLKSFVGDKFNTQKEMFENNISLITKYLELNFLTKKKQLDSYDENYLNRPIKTDNGLNYDWLYELSSAELENLINKKGITSEELIYISDALKKRKETEVLVDNYDQKTKIKDHKQKKNAAFIDMILLSLITGSFGILLLLSIVN